MISGKIENHPDANSSKVKEFVPQIPGGTPRDFFVSLAQRWYDVKKYEMSVDTPRTGKKLVAGDVKMNVSIS
jgi:hypothetical protein